jgi:hypothetical protein
VHGSGKVKRRLVDECRGLAFGVQVKGAMPEVGARAIGEVEGDPGALGVVVRHGDAGIDRTVQGGIDPSFQNRSRCHHGRFADHDIAVLQADDRGPVGNRGAGFALQAGVADRQGLGFTGVK